MGLVMKFMTVGGATLGSRVFGFARETLMAAVWGGDSPSLDRTVDAHIKSLRAKCKEAAPSIDPILTHRGTGYALRDDL